MNFRNLALRLGFLSVGLLLLLGSIYALGAITQEDADSVTGGLNGIVWGVLLVIISLWPKDGEKQPDKDGDSQKDNTEINK